MLLLMLLFFCHPRTEWQCRTARDERGLSNAPRQYPYKMLSSIITSLHSWLKNPNCDFHALWSLKWTDIEMQPFVIRISFHASHRSFKSTWVHLNHLVTQLQSITFYYKSTSCHPGPFFDMFHNQKRNQQIPAESAWSSLGRGRTQWEETWSRTTLKRNKMETETAIGKPSMMTLGV